MKNILNGVTSAVLLGGLVLLLFWEQIETFATPATEVHFSYIDWYLIGMFYFGNLIQLFGESFYYIQAILSPH